MRRLFQSLSAAVAMIAAICWLATGANRGWTKTSVEVKTVDPVTGIEGISYEKRFKPGVDFLGAALVVAVVLGGVSLLYKPAPRRA